ncbi:hypothetical protein PF004_g26537 [Phytophthora fragariae]|uniref:Uncharacterized protein n=1 Tax=Phytophthora fragariae TaxID=53985 RepID=A0A6G0MN52_9STRA|nr:hypothetical protein PF004_g26537 [Phytophthora fragariae]
MSMPQTTTSVELLRQGPSLGRTIVVSRVELADSNVTERDVVWTKVLLETRANVSVISASFAKKLRVREVLDHDCSLEVRGINPAIMETQRRALVKGTLGWKHAYEFEMWVMDNRDSGR